MMFKILILEKAGFDIHRYKSMHVFSENGFEIVGSTYNMTEAIDQTAKGRFDLLIVINRESGMIGAEILRTFVKKKQDVPTLIISCADSAKDMRDCFLLGALDYLVEPITEDDIAASLKRASKAISVKVLDREYLKAIDNAVLTLNINEANSAMYEKLIELLMKFKGRAATVEEAADYFGFNPDYFRRVFKMRFGTSFTDFYKKLMMDYARLLLLSGHYKVSEVSDLLGFSSSDYFTRVFKKITGRIPSEYRK